MRKTSPPLFWGALSCLLVGLVLFSWMLVNAQAPDPSLFGQWTTLANLPFFPVHAHLLPTGKVMIWAGDTDPNAPHIENTQQWDPANQTVTPLALPGWDLFCSGHTFLADGRLFVAGGHIQNGVGSPNAGIYNPSTNTWATAPNMNAGRWYPTVTTLANGDALVVSGSVDNTVGVNPLPQVYQAATNTWRSLTSAQLAMDLYPRMFLAPDGRVFNAAPSQTTRYLDTLGTGAWQDVANSNFGYRDYGSAVMYADGKILVLGGGDPPTNTAEVIDLNQPSPTWRTVAPMSIARRQVNATLLPDGTVLVTGGTSGPGFNNDTTPVYPAELWDPATETWRTLASATVPRLYHSACTLLPDGRVLSTGGDNYPTPEIFSPPYLFKGARPTMSGVPATIGHGQHFSVQSPDAATITKVTLIRITSVTHAFNMNQRLNVLSFTPGSGTLDIVAPATANIAPPGHYLLFLVNDKGVPSVGSVVRLDLPPPLPCPTTGSTTYHAQDDYSGFQGCRNWYYLYGSGTPMTFDSTAGSWQGNEQYLLLWNNGGHPGNLSDAIRRWVAPQAGSVRITGNALDVNTACGGGVSVSIAKNATVLWQQTLANGNTAGIGFDLTTTVLAGDNVNFAINRGPDGNNSCDATGFDPTIVFTPAGAPVAVPNVVNQTQAAATTALGNAGLTVGTVSTASSTTVPAGSVISQTPGAGTLVAPGSAVALVVSSGPPSPPPPPTLSALTPSSTPAGGSAFTLTVTGSNFVSGSVVRWNGAGRTTSFTSSTQLTAAIAAADIATPGTAQVTVANPAGAVSNALTFTIAAAATTCQSCSIWTTAATPAVASVQDASPVELGVRFSSDVAGVITGIRFYKGSQNTGPHTGKLWTATGTLMASATFSGETASGWQEVRFATPVAIIANTTYVASYYTASGFYSVTRPYFTSQFSSPPLRALADGDGGGNGVYQYGTGGFPTSTFNSTNYWVDVVFTTTAPPPPPCLTGSTTYHAQDDYSGFQGCRNWYYLYGSGTPMTFDASNGWWQGNEPYLLLWNNGGHPGNLSDAIRRWVAPQAGSVRITGNALDVNTACGGGVSVSIAKNATVLWQQTLANGNTAGIGFDLTTTVLQGDSVNFSINRGPDGNNSCDATGFDPTIVFTPGGAPVAVPNVVNQTQAAATTALGNAGLTVGTVSTASSTTVPAGSVISQTPGAGTLVAPGSAVALVVSSGPSSVPVPNVVNQTQAAATTNIVNAGLTVGTVSTASSTTVPAGSVISQNPGAGTLVAPGSAVALVVSSGPLPTLSINDVTVTEGNTGSVNAVFTVTLSAASTQQVTVDYATANGTATAGIDYTATSGTLTFAAGQTSHTITVPVLGGTVSESTETFVVNLSNPVNATIADGQGRGTILDNDGGPAGLVLAFGFEEGTGTTTADVSGNAHPGTLVGATWTTTGKYGRAVALNGSTQYVRVDVPSAPTGDFSWMVWANPTTLSGWRGLLEIQTSGSAGVELALNAGRPQVWSNGQLRLTATGVLAVNTWTHVALTRGGSTLTVYVNGVSVGTATETAAFSWSTCPFLIGVDADSGCTGQLNGQFAGQLDEFRLYNRALSPTEIQAAMNAPLPAP